MLYKAMSFLRDAHSSINGKQPAGGEAALKEMAYIDQSVTMDKDEKVYCQTYEDGKWYYDAASDESIRIEPMLLKNGKVVYCPLVLAPSGRASRGDTLTLEKDGAVKEVPISWTMCQDAARENSSGGFVVTKAIGDVYYINYLDMAIDLDDQYWGEYMELCRQNTTGEYTGEWIMCSTQMTVRGADDRKSTPSAGNGGRGTFADAEGKGKPRPGRGGALCRG